MGGAVLDLMERIWRFATGDAPEAESLIHEAKKGADAVGKGALPKKASPRLRGLIDQKIVY